MIKNRAPAKQTKTLVLLDAHAILHRAYHALPAFTSPSGEPTGAVYGFTTMLLKVIRELKPDYVAACYDLPEPTFRHAAYEQYKAKRPAMDDELAAQISRSRDVLAVFGIPVYERAGFEADDILGTIAAALRAKKDLRTIIASGDTDTLQLVRKNTVVVYMLRKGIQDAMLYDEPAVRERFGFPPTSLPDFKGLKGDPSDNIIGVPGIGDKTATALITRFGTLEELYRQLKRDPEKVKAAGVTARIMQLLITHEEDALFSKTLASIRTDAPIDFSLERAAWRGITEYPRIERLFLSLGFQSLLGRLCPGTVQPRQDDGGAAEEIAVSEPDDAGIARLGNSLDRLWFWDETRGQVGIVAREKTVKRPFVLFLDAKTIRAQKSALQSLSKETERNSAFDAKKLYKIFWAHGITPAFRVDFFIAGWLIDPEASSVDGALRALGVPGTRDTEPERTSLAATMAALLIDAPRIAELLRKRTLERVLFEIEMPVTRALARMEERGILVDLPYLRVRSTAYHRELDALEKRIFRLTGVTFNLNSPKQLGAVLFETLGIGGKGKKTKGGTRSTKFSELVKLKNAHPAVPLILRYREAAKLLSTYIDRIPELTGGDGRVHTVFQQTGTVTGRLSSTNPNLQNIPIRTTEGNDVRNAFRSERGWKLLSCDYSQIELRIAAMLSKDQKMTSAFLEKKDIHAITAAAVFHVDEREVTPEMRRRAKVINFGILYGMGPNALASNLGISRDEAAAFIAAYFEQFSGVSRYLEETKRSARANGYVETLFGRRRYLPEIRSPIFMRAREAERMAINAPIQGTAADIIKIAMAAIEKEIEQRWQDCVFPLLQIHDELLFETRDDILKEATARIIQLMEHAHRSDIPLEVNAKSGTRWGNLR